MNLSQVYRERHIDIKNLRVTVWDPSQPLSFTSLNEKVMVEKVVHVGHKLLEGRHYEIIKDGYGTVLRMISMREINVMKVVFVYTSSL